MKITVILCTYNRSELLAKALQSIASLGLLEAAEWEVLVVDNNSTDRTRAVVEEFCSRHPGRFRYMFEPQPGKSHALNAGIRAASGEILAFTDDDVTVEPTWLHNLTAPLQNLEWCGVGGRTLPEQGVTMPRWLSAGQRQTLDPLAIFDRGTAGFELKETPFGNNMAFRKAVFDKHGGFRTDLGPRPDSEIRSEDTELCQRLLSAKEKLWYEPTAVVYHAIAKNRLRKAYFQSWWFDKARGDVRAFPTAFDPCWRASGVPLVLFRRLAMWTLRWMTGVNPSRRFASKIKVWWVAGTIRECFHRSRAPL
jgi:glycosyltransferase involved in cell wall biosynthesis